jgi:Zn-dependent peptidase ImmA (M78 family)
MHIKLYSPLPAFMLARHLNITILRPEQVPGITQDMLGRLLRTYGSYWSAFTLPFDECTVIIHNTTQSPGRRESNLMHEIAHVLCKHRPVLVLPTARFPFPTRGFDQNCEREATGLASCLLLPRPAVEWAIKRRMRERDVLGLFCISAKMLKWRLHQTGLWSQAASMFY